MSELPFFVEQYRDELLYSWICRLAKANGLSVSIFCGAYLRLKVPKASSLPYDVRTGFPEFYKLIRPSAGLLETYLTTSTLPFESTGMTPYQLARYVNNVFQPPGPLNTPVKPLIRKIRVCPACMDEDREQYGEPYLHRAHQLSGVCICHKHGTRLLEYQKPRRAPDKQPAVMDITIPAVMNFNIDDFAEMPMHATPEASVAYARYAHEFLDAGVVTDFHKLIYAILDRLEETGLDDKQFLAGLEQWEYASLFDDLAALQSSFWKERNGTTGHFTALMSLYPDPSDAIAALTALGTNMKEYVCTECGEIYCSATKNRWTCPRCTRHMKDQDLFELQFSIAGERRYVPLTPFSSMNSKVLFLDTATGEKKEIAVKNFLYRETRIGQAIPCKSKWHWDQWLKRYLRFFAETGSVYVPQVYIYEGEALGRWVSLQRELMRNGELAPDRAERLLSVVPDFFSDDIVPKNVDSPKYKQYFDDTWETMYESYLRFMKQFKTFRIPVDEVFEGSKLGDWLERQRIKGHNGTLPPERMQKLLDADPEFFSYGAASRRAHEEKEVVEWNTKYELYVQYVHETESVHVRAKDVYEGVKIGSWLSNQRKLEKQGKLLPDRKEKLLAVDPDLFSHDIAVMRAAEDRNYENWGQQWDLCLNVFIQYITEKDDLYIPTQEIYRGIHLGKWVSRQRELEKKGILLPERRQKLLEIDPDFFSKKVISERCKAHQVNKAYEKKWQQKFLIYKKCVEEKEDLYISVSEEYHGEKIGMWAFCQRKYEKDGSLSPERRQKLLEIDPDFFSKKIISERCKAHQVNKAYDQKWQKKFLIYKQCVEEKEDLYISASEEYHGEKIGMWVYDQRKYEKKSSLSPERKQKLLEVDPYFFNEKVLHDRSVQHRRKNSHDKESP